MNSTPAIVYIHLQMLFELWMLQNCSNVVKRLHWSLRSFHNGTLCQQLVLPVFHCDEHINEFLLCNCFLVCLPVVTFPVLSRLFSSVLRELILQKCLLSFIFHTENMLETSYVIFLCYHHPFVWAATSTIWMMHNTYVAHRNFYAHKAFLLHDKTFHLTLMPSVQNPMHECKMHKETLKWMNMVEIANNSESNNSNNKDAEWGEKN